MVSLSSLGVILESWVGETTMMSLEQLAVPDWFVFDRTILASIFSKTTDGRIAFIYNNIQA
jgi:hypothetical protein